MRAEDVVIGPAKWTVYCTRQSLRYGILASRSTSTGANWYEHSVPLEARGSISLECRSLSQPITSCFDCSYACGFGARTAAGCRSPKNRYRPQSCAFA